MALALVGILLVFLLTACGEKPAEEELASAAAQAYDAGFSEGYAAGMAEARPSEAEKLPAAAAPEPSMDSSGFVLVSEAVPDAILEIRYYSTYNFVGERIDGYEEPTALLTREAAEALRAVSDALVPQGYRLKIYDAYRPQCAVDHFKAWAQDVQDIRMKPFFYPEVDKSELFDSGYIASRSGHSRGSTVDLTLFDMKEGKEVDMGGVFDYFGERSHADYSGELTRTQIANRTLLRETMVTYGFRGISTEWWHFTLEDEPYPDTWFNFPVADLAGTLPEGS